LIFCCAAQGKFEPTNRCTPNCHFQLPSRTCYGKIAPEALTKEKDWIMNGTIYEVNSPKNERFMSLVGDLQSDIKNLIKKELELAKAEMSEKAKVMGRNAAYLGAGAVVALMAVFLLILGLGALIAQLLQKTDLSPGIAYFIGYFGLGIVLVIVGYGLIQKAIHAFSSVSLAPEKAIATAKGEEVPIHVKHNEKKASHEQKLSTDELKTQADHARNRMESEMVELKNRLTPGYMAKSFVAGMKHHPLRALIVTVATTGLGGLVYWRKQQHANSLALKRKHLKRRAWLFKLGHA